MNKRQLIFLFQENIQQNLYWYRYAFFPAYINWYNTRIKVS